MGKKGFAIFALMVMSGAAIYFGLGVFTKNRVEKEISKKVFEMSAVDDLRYEVLKVGLLGSWFRLDDVALKIRGLDEPIRIGRIHIPEYRMEADELARLDLRLDEVRIPSKYYNSVAFSSGSRRVLKSEHIPVDLRLTYNYDPSTRKLNLEDLEIVSSELGNAEAAVSLENIDVSKISWNNPVVAAPSLIGVSIAFARVEYFDNSGVENLLRNPDGSSTHAFAALTENISREIRRMERKGVSPSARGVLEKIRRFLKKPEKITITASPGNPVPLGRFLWIKNPEDVLNILNVRVELR